MPETKSFEWKLKVEAFYDKKKNMGAEIHKVVDGNRDNVWYSITNMARNLAGSDEATRLGDMLDEDIDSGNFVLDHTGNYSVTVSFEIKEI